MRSQSISIQRDHTSSPQVTAKDTYAQFQNLLISNREEYEAVIHENRQALSIMYDDETIDKMLANIAFEYRVRELNIFAEEIARRHGWVRDYGGSSALVPDLVLALQTIGMLLSRMRVMEQRLDDAIGKPSVPSGT